MRMIYHGRQRLNSRTAVEEFGYKYDAEATKIPNDWRGKM